MIFSPIDIASLSILVLFLMAALAALLRQNQHVLAVVCSFLTGIASLLAVIAGVCTVGSRITGKTVLLIGLPDLPFHLRLDPLSGFFLTVIGLLSFFVSVYSAGYLRGVLGHRPVTRL